VSTVSEALIELTTTSTTSLGHEHNVAVNIRA